MVYSGGKKSESILIFLKANWGMKPQTEIVRGKPTVKIAKGKGSKFYCIWEWKVCTLELGWWQWMVLCLIFCSVRTREKRDAGSEDERSHGNLTSAQN